MRDPKTEEFKNQIGQGCKVKMDETGNILIKRMRELAFLNKGIKIIFTDANLKKEKVLNDNYPDRLASITID